MDVDTKNRALVGLLGPVAMSLGMGNVPGDTDVADLIALIVVKIRQLREDQTNALVALHDLRGNTPVIQTRPPHDQQFRILNIDDEIVWSTEWEDAGVSIDNRLAATKKLAEMTERGTDFGMRVERYQRCRWVNLTTVAEDEPS